MKISDFKVELIYTAVRSGGAGGQHVNKVSTKVVLKFNIAASKVLREDQKALLLVKLGNRLNKNMELVLTCNQSRSQFKNKELVGERFIQLLTEGLKVKKKRKKLKRSKSDNLKRLKLKSRLSDKKAGRKKIIL